MSKNENPMSTATKDMEDNVDLDIYKIITNYPENLEGKMLIAKNVVISLFLTDKTTPIDDIFSEIHNLTGVDDATIKAIYNSLPMVKTFSDWFHEKSLEKVHSSCVTFEKLRDIITHMYTEELTIVTVPRLVCTLKQINPNFDEGKLRNDFKQHGYTWKRLPGTNKSVIVEKTCQFMERMAYLTKVRRYREEGRYFVYLHVDKCVVASGSSGLINVDSVNSTKGSKFTNLHRWLLNILILFLPPKCILVAPKSARGPFRVTPICSSLKTDMRKWLKENGIAYDSQSPKAELFSLVKKYERVCPKAKCHTEEVLKSHGHEILWYPPGLPALDYFSRIVMDYNKFMNVTHVFEDVTLDNWRDYEIDLISKENKIYEEDLKVEMVLDKLLTLAKYGGLSSEDLDDCDTALADDEYISSLVQ